MDACDALASRAPQLELERKVQKLLMAQKSSAVQEAELAIRLCTGASVPP